MKKSDKSTPEMVQEMIKLYQDGVALAEIGRRFKLDHTSVLYWVRKANLSLRGKSFTEKQRVEIVEKMRMVRKKEGKKFEPDQRKIRRAVWHPELCFNCQKPKTDPKWTDTNFCGLKCWDEWYTKPRSKNTISSCF